MIAERLYARFGSRVVIVMLGVSLGISILAVVVTAYLAGQPYLDWSAAETFAMQGMTIGLVVAALGIGFWRARDEIRAVLAVTADTDPAQAWLAIVGAPRDVVGRAGTLAIASVVPIAGVAMVALTDQPAWVVAPVVTGALALGTSSMAAAMFAMELGLRPMLADVGSRLPAGFQAPARSWRLRTKTLAPLPLVTYVAALFAGALAHDSDGPTRLAITAGISLALAAIASVVYLVVMRAALDPIDDLLQATERVTAGDLTARVPVITADELGELSSSFNRMIDELHGRTEELRESRARLVATADAERRRVERDLHDGAQQSLIVLQLMAGQLERRLSRDANGPALAAELRAAIDRAMGELRDLAHGIYPASLENDGLPAALQDAAERAALPTHVECNGAGRYPAEVEAAVYFCCLEALQNAGKHAGEGATARVMLRERDGELLFSVTDDGRGLSGPPAGHGVDNMRDRIGALGGGLTLESSRGAGTTVRGRIPVVRDG